jgi:predicted dehydrogenase
MKVILRRSSRRRFLSRTTVGLGTISIVPGFVLGLRGQTPPSGKLNIACIGIGGQGGASVGAAEKENIVALCDADNRRVGQVFEKHPQAKRFQDFRKMFDEMEKSIDAVTVATPDHAHVVAALAAIKRGKHVFCEKPLAHSVGEVRTLMKAAREHKVVTQLGNQGHSSDSIRTFCEWIWDGAIGNVHTVHAACGSVYSRLRDLPRLTEEQPVPEGLDWDLWLGPAKVRPYNRMYLPAIWRGWTAFGNGVIGDWVCHVVDPSFWALDLGAPATIQAEAKDYDPKADAETFPVGLKITYEFPAKGKRGPVKLVWHDGRDKPPRPAEMETGDEVPGTGAVVLGDKGTIIHGSHGAGGVRLIPGPKMAEYKKHLPPKKLPRVRGHHEDWLDAIKQGRQAGSNFDYGGPLTEIALLGIVAMRRLGQKLEWDGPGMRFPNDKEANQYLDPPHRAGWGLA